MISIKRGVSNEECIGKVFQRIALSVCFPAQSQMAGEMDVLCITSKHVKVLSMAKSERPLLGHEACASGFEGVHLPGCLRTNADNQAKIADTTNLISENTAIQANETNTPKKKQK